MAGKTGLKGMTLDHGFSKKKIFSSSLFFFRREKNFQGTRTYCKENLLRKISKQIHDRWGVFSPIATIKLSSLNRIRILVFKKGEIITLRNSIQSFSIQDVPVPVSYILTIIEAFLNPHTFFILMQQKLALGLRPFSKQTQSNQ